MLSLENSIAVVGAGYVGLVTSACFASFGYDVYVIETDNQKIEALKQAKIPIYEPGLTELVEEALASKRLHFFSSAHASLPPITTRSGRKKSATAVPSFKNSGLFTTDTSSARLSFAMSFLISSAVPTGTVDFKTTTD
jgi:threonine dehydrogenase-like Zn-dependent dehydrogenase